MKSGICFFLLIFIITSCNSNPKTSTKKYGRVVYIQKDKEILDQVFDILLDDKNAPLPVLMIKVGTFFKETTYVAQTLETEPEQLVVNLREFDCNTFIESVLAISRTIKSKNPTFEQFTGELQNMRYRNGQINGYSSRIHYFSDWIYENSKKKLVQDISEEIAKTPYPLQINFMSTHPESYIQLRDSGLIPLIANQEKEISSRKMFYIPEEKLAGVEHLLNDGDIVGITTGIKGLDISHVGILARKEGRIHLMHASTSAMKVILSDETLEDYLMNSKSATGIMVARPQ
jgi:hypothetical protein